MIHLAIAFLWCVLIGSGPLGNIPTGIAAEVTHEDIRGNIQSLIYSYNQLDNKLERHEHRERALGELLKKALQSLQKGQKSMEPINGIFARLDERVSQIETMLINQEDKYSHQTQKFGDALEHMFKWMRENDECFKRPPGGPPAAAVPAAPAVSPEFLKQQEQTNALLLKKLETLSGKVEQLLDASRNMMEPIEVAFKSAPTTAEMLSKIEDKLVSYSVAPVTAASPLSAEIDEFEHKMFERFDGLRTDIADLRASTPKGEVGLTATDKEFIHGLANDTLSALEALKANVLSASESAVESNANNLKESEHRVLANVTGVLKAVNSSAQFLEKFYDEVMGSYTKMNDALEVFTRFNDILMTNSEYLLATQRKVEFGTIQIVQKISDLLDKQRDVLNARFDNVDESIVSSQGDSLQNLTAMVEAEISHVWRQISIMHGEITDTKDMLQKLSGRNDVFVNGTYSAMSTMGTKVETIKGTMHDMEENLNYLMGRLSMMSQEFNNIKVGLASALEELRQSFHNVQDKLPASGPGPHTIPSNEYETELNLLNKRHVAS